jgi:excisionase family DNA binding protein
MADLLTVKQFAEEMQASDGTIRNWIRMGIIPVYHVRYVIRIDREAALEALQNFKRPRKRKAKPREPQEAAVSG